MFGSLWSGLSGQPTSGGGTDEKALLSVAFNQSNTHIAVSTMKGYHVFAVDPFQERAHRYFPYQPSDAPSSSSTMSSASDGSADLYAKQNQPDPAPYTGKFSRRYYGIGCIEMMFRSQIFALVGGGPNPLFGARNKVVVYDDQSQQSIGDVTLAKPIRAVRLNRQVLVAAIEDKVLVYDHDLRQIHAFETALQPPPPRACVVLSPAEDNPILAFPAVQKGHVRVQNLGDSSHRYIQAHDGDIACLGLSRDGRRLGTASAKGTVLRVFDTETGKRLTEVRRGTTNQTIYSIAFSNDNRYMACCSSSGTVHLFDISATAPSEPLAVAAPPAVAGAAVDQQQPPQSQQQQQTASQATNRTSSLSVLSYVGMDYAASQWSMAEFKSVETPALVAFGPSDRQVRVVTFAGTFYDLQFDLTTGSVASKVQSFSKLLEQQ